MIDNRKMVQEAIEIIEKTPQIPADVQEKLVEKLMSVASPLEWDPIIYRMVVAFLGATVVLTVAGGLSISAFSGSSTPEGIIALGSAAVGALAGLLAPSPVNKG